MIKNLSGYNMSFSSSLSLQILKLDHRAMKTTGLPTIF